MVLWVRICTDSPGWFCWSHWGLLMCTQLSGSLSGAEWSKMTPLTRLLVWDCSVGSPTGELGIRHEMAEFRKGNSPMWSIGLCKSPGPKPESMREGTTQGCGYRRHESLECTTDTFPGYDVGPCLISGHQPSMETYLPRKWRCHFCSQRRI